MQGGTMEDKRDIWSTQVSERETAMLKQSYERMRRSLSVEHSASSLARANEELAIRRQQEPWRQLSIVEGSPYQVEGEAGLWSFATHRIIDHETRRPVFDTRSEYPEQRGKIRYRTKGVMELLMFYGVSQISNRAAARLLARIRHQDRTVAATTLRDLAEDAGMAINAAVEREAERVYQQHAPIRGSIPPVVHADLPQVTAAEMEQAREAAEIPEELARESATNPVPITSPAATVLIAPDAVFCKMQKEHRSKSAGKADATGPDKGRKTVSTCCATVSILDHQICLMAATYEKLLTIVIATLFANQLTGMHLCLLSDGERRLRDVFIPGLKVYGASLLHILDWHHLDKRCSQLFSMALKGKEIRNRHRAQLLRLLWYGCVDSAVSYIRDLPAADIKYQKPLDELTEYILKRRDQIPVYAIRRELGLANSSNSVEKANDRLVSTRQKGLGMSWSQTGSSALAAIRMVACNKQERLWLSTGTISLNLLKKTG